MKLDAEVLRNILLAVENSSEWVQEIHGVPEEIFCYHAKHLIEAEFIDGDTLPNGDSNIPAAAVLRDLKWNGHEFLKATKDENLWNKAKDKIINTGAAWSVNIMLEYLNLEIKRHLGFDQGS